MSRHQASPASIQSGRTHQQPVPLAKRLLFPALSTNVLPPILASQDIPPELTTELYDFVALALRAYVNPWWTKITRYDKEFLPEISRILAHVLRALEARALATDLSPLIYKHLPLIIVQHYRDYRNASSKLGTSYASGGALSLPQLFHQLQPHMALSPDGTIDQDYFRQVIDCILKACLPPEDYAPDAERVIVREIVLKVVLKDILPRITQPWFIHKVILDQLGPQPMPVDLKPQDKVPPTSHPSPFSLHAILVLLLSAIQAISGGCLALIHTYKQAMNTIKLVNQSSGHRDSPISTPPCVATPEESSPRHHSDSQTQTSPKSLPKSISSASYTDPLSISPTPSISSSTSSLPKAPLIPSSFPPPPLTSIDESYREERTSPNYAFPPILMVTEIFSTKERLASNTILGTVLMFASCFNDFIDRLLQHLLTKIFSSNFLLNVVRTGKRTLFPNGYPAPPPVDPTPEEQAEMRAKLVAWKGNGAAATILPLLLGSDPSETLSFALDPLSNQACNMHLVLMILDSVSATLFPELLNTSHATKAL